MIHLRALPPSSPKFVEHETNLFIGPINAESEPEIAAESVNAEKADASNAESVDTSREIALEAEIDPTLGHQGLIPGLIRVGVHLEDVTRKVDTAETEREIAEAEAETEEEETAIPDLKASPIAEVSPAEAEAPVAADRLLGTKREDHTVNLRSAHLPGLLEIKAERREVLAEVILSIKSMVTQRVKRAHLLIELKMLSIPTVEMLEQQQLQLLNELSNSKVK